METAICKNSSENIQDDTVILDSKSSDFTSLGDFAVPEISLMENSKTPNDNGGGCQISDSFESHNVSASVAQKSLSPTIIEQAYNVMKYLFSPNKNSYKSTNNFTPVQENVFESPCNNIGVQNSVGFHTPESDIEISPVVQSVSLENSLKSDDSEMNQLGIMQSSLNCDIHNSTDDSYLTTVSLIDDSFQSAVTHLDENGETLRGFVNVQENTFNNMYGSDGVDPCNDTLENSLYCLDNTMLQNGSFTSEGAKIGDISSESRKSNEDNMDTTQFFNFNYGKENENMTIIQAVNNLENPGKIVVNEPNMKTVQSTELIAKRNENNSISNCNQTINNLDLEKEKSQDVLNGVFEKLISCNESHKKNTNLALENEFLSKSLERGEFPGLCDENKQDDEILGKIGVKYMKNITEKQTNNESILIPNEERDNLTEKSISTTTVILDHIDSAEPNNFLLKARGSEFPNKSFTPKEVQKIRSILPEENKKKSEVSSKIASSESDFKQFIHSVNSSLEKKSSEGSSPTKARKKNKLSKSDDHIIIKSFSESPKIKNSSLEKQMEQSLIDTPLVKISEASEKATLTHNELGDLKTEVNGAKKNLGSCDVNNFKFENCSQEDDDNNSLGGVASEEILGVVSQGSYTVIYNENTNLNRPVVNLSEDYCDLLSRNLSINSDTKNSEVIENKASMTVSSFSSEKGLSSLSESSVAFSVEDYISSDVSSSGSAQTVKDSEISETQETSETEILTLKKEPINNNEEILKLSTTKTMVFPSVNDELTQYSPITPVNDGFCVFFNTAEKEERNSFQEPHTLNSTLVLSEAKNESLKETFVKKIDLVQESIADKSLNSSISESSNEISDKNLKASPVNTQNETFDKKVETPPSKKKLKPQCKKKFESSNRKKMESSPNKKKSESPKSSHVSYKKSPPPSRKNHVENKMEISSVKSLNQTFEKTLDPPNKINQAIEKEVETSPMKILNQTYDTKTSSNDMNQVFEEISEPSNQLILSNGKRADTPPKEVLNQTYDKNSSSPVALNETFKKKSESPAPNEMNQTFVSKPEAHSVNKLNQTFVKNSESSTLNETFNKNQLPSIEIIYKKPESPQPFNLNETFVKKSTSSPPKDVSQSFTIKKDFSPQKELNQSTDLKVDSSIPSKLILNKGTEDSELNAANEGFNKTSDSMPQFKLNQSSVNTSECPTLKKINQLFEKNNDITKSQTEEIKENAGSEDDVFESLEDINSKNEDVGMKNSNKFNSITDCKVKVSHSENSIQSLAIKGKEAMPSEFFIHSDNSTTQVSEGIEFVNIKEPLNGSFVSTTSSNSSLLGTCNSTVLHQEAGLISQKVDDLASQLKEMNLSDGSKTDLEEWADACSITSEMKLPAQNTVKDQNVFPENELFNTLKNDNLQFDQDLAQLIQEQFSSTDIEKICSVVDDLSSKSLSSQILKASDSFLKSRQQNVHKGDSNRPQTCPKSDMSIDVLSPHTYDFLSSVGGKTTGRDLSRESLYVKFDPLVQPPNANSLIDFTREVEAMEAAEVLPESNVNTSVCEQLLAISPEKTSKVIVPPLTPLSHRNKGTVKEDKLKELQNEIYFLKNLYAEREKTNKMKMDEYESQVTMLTGKSCVLEDKLKESNEREKSLVKKLKEQTQCLDQLKVIMEEYVKVIAELTAQLESMKKESAKEIAALIAEKDSYVTHLQNTEAAFTDVHAKYEKSKKTIVNLKANEAMYRNTIAEQTQKLEDFKERAREIQEKAFNEYQKVQEELNNLKASKTQESARLKAQLRKTELKLEAMQESLDQKIKENEQLTAICDELIEGKK